MPYIFPFIKYSIKFVKIGICQYCGDTDAVSKRGTCIVCKQRIKRFADQRKRASRKLDPKRLDIFRKKENRKKQEWLAKMKIEDPAKYRKHQQRKTINKRNSKRRQVIAYNKQNLTILKKKLDDHGPD